MSETSALSTFVFYRAADAISTAKLQEKFLRRSIESADAATMEFRISRDTDALC
jgi:hypothetical protein